MFIPYTNTVKPTNICTDQSFSLETGGCSLAKMFLIFYGTQISTYSYNHYHLGLSYLQYKSKSNGLVLKAKKSKFHPRTGHDGPEGKQRYSSTLFLTSALDGVGGQRHVPAALTQGTPW